MKSFLIKPIFPPESEQRQLKVFITIRGLPKNTLFRVLLADDQSGRSFFNQEFDMGDVMAYYLTVEVPGDIKELMVRCRDSAGKYQCWERVLPLKEALNQGVSVDIRPADFGKGLGDALMRSG